MSPPEGTTEVAAAPSVPARRPEDKRVLAMIAAARFHGVELDPLASNAPRPGSEPARLAEWARDNGLSARAVRLRWSHLVGETGNGPVVALLKDGGAALAVGATPGKDVVFLRDPSAPEGGRPVPVDQARLEAVWDGTTVLVGRQRVAASEESTFDLHWLLRLLGQEKGLARGTLMAALVLSFLALAGPLLVMGTLDRVLAHEGYATLTLIAVLFGTVALYEAGLTFAREHLLLALSTRVDVRINTFVLDRLLRLPIDYFERQPAGDTTHRLQQVWRLRDFITGRVGTLVLDGTVLFFALPVLFALNWMLALFVLGAALLLATIIVVFIPSIRRASAKALVAETRKNGFLVETVHGIRTIKTLAMEPARKAEWDKRVADSTSLRRSAGLLAVWPNVLGIPIERFMGRGVFLIGAYLALVRPESIPVGGLMAIMMLSGRVSGPLVTLARVLTDLEDIKASIHQAGEVLNAPPETAAGGGGVRPRFTGALSMDRVSYTYPDAARPALRELTLKLEIGTMLGVVGRSGSGKSTLVRLLQGSTRNYSGLIKFDDVELRELDLGHLRRSVGVVLQESFLFRATIRENILAGRPHLTMDDALRAARLASAEEFIEQLPRGYDTLIEEGGANLSGGQRQRLAIARALVNDPRILLLDEATSALDPESEALVNASLRRIAAGRTLIIVSHRLSSLTDCDAIAVLNEGKLEDVAPHATLVDRCATYRHLWLQQKARV
ncbi:peptidase domain-containing ABC transporter [Roseomonas hellenica]|uniref:Peptidase domain-containing ABC transporter n=1 Tax=Plastoroseomonas hellenica TaxID=2687306 RepID=A0ABS5EZ58_9PROT|nr:peptidase domain-containing ABC transporter [Plastoroseomonas hellenica]MBR0665576.1 peptidase domain-containing ABC transporter [Plastoroseomonas hellenica]